MSERGHEPAGCCSGAAGGNVQYLRLPSRERMRNRPWRRQYRDRYGKEAPGLQMYPTQAELDLLESAELAGEMEEDQLRGQGQRPT